MSLFTFFRRASDSSREAAKAETPAKPAPAPTPPAAAAKPAPAAASSDPLREAVEMFDAIQEVMGKSEDIIRIPSRVLLSGLPPELRGPLWNTNAYPNAPIELERKPLLQQLQKGRVVYKLNELALSLPPGWVKSDADAMVELNLAELVSTLPADLFQVSSAVDEELAEVARMRDLFGPPKPAEPPPTPAPPEGAPVEAAPGRPKAPAVERPLVRREVRLTAPDGWDGVDRVADAGAEVVDINQADYAELARVPGLKGSRARRILAYRQQFGPYRGIYELLAVPGIGRKVFRRATGLEPGLRRRGDRHAKLNELLGLPREERPSLARVAERTVEILGAEACVIAGKDGFVLARTEKAAEADRYAAVAPKLFRRTRRYLKQLTGSPVCALHLPTTEPPLFTVFMPSCHLIVVLRADNDQGAALRQAAHIAEELDWLLSCRAAVRSGV